MTTVGEKASAGGEPGGGMGARTGVAAALTAGVVAATSGCGGGSDSSFADRSGADIMRAAATDMASVTSLHFVGDITSGGRRIHVDLRSSTAGECQGSMQIDRGTAQIVSSSGQAWMKPDHAFWEQQSRAQAARVERLVGDRWVAIPLSSGLSKVCDLDHLLERLSPSDQQAARSTVVGTTTVDGAEAVQVHGISEQGDTVSAWVATQDPHHVLELSVADGSSPGTITFSEFDVPLDVETPSADEVATIPGS
jgi:hypothetical protein